MTTSTPWIRGLAALALVLAGYTPAGDVVFFPFADSTACCS